MTLSYPYDNIMSSTIQSILHYHPGEAFGWHNLRYTWLYLVAKIKIDINPIPILQLPLFDYGESISNVVELFPTVWQATEWLTAPDPSTRQRGMDSLLELGAQKVSPLVAYVIATLLSDPEINIRRRVIYILADLISGDSSRKQTPEEVRQVVVSYLHNLNETTVISLL